jgi:flagellar biosynthesis chaperone FliJ
VIDRRAARALLAARESLRDAAAATHLGAVALESRLAEETATRHAELARAYDDAAAARRAATSVEALAQSSRAVEVARQRLAEAATRRDLAAAQTERAAAALRGRSKDARSAAVLTERAERAHAIAEHCREQRTYDDLGARLRAPLAPK